MSSYHNLHCLRYSLTYCFFTQKGSQCFLCSDIVGRHVIAFLWMSTFNALKMECKTICGITCIIFRIIVCALIIWNQLRRKKCKFSSCSLPYLQLAHCSIKWTQRSMRYAKKNNLLFSVNFRPLAEQISLVWHVRTNKIVTRILFK